MAEPEATTGHDVVPCAQCSGPLSETRAVLGLTLCSGACHRARAGLPPLTIEELIEASSLGTPAAKAARDSVPVERAREIVRRAHEPVDVEHQAYTTRDTAPRDCEKTACPYWEGDSCFCGYPIPAAVKEPYVPPLARELADRVRVNMTRRRLSQATLAGYVGVSEKHLSQVLTGRADGSIPFWDALLRESR